MSETVHYVISSHHNRYLAFDGSITERLDLAQRYHNLEHADEVVRAAKCGNIVEVTTSTALREIPARR